MIKQTWSYSRLSMYEKCPAQYEWHYILDNRRKSSPALERGIDIHKKAEEYVKGNIKSIPPELGLFSKEFKALASIYKLGKGFTEPDISFNKDGSHANRKTSDYFIGFADFLTFDNLTCHVIDYKTGKPYDTHKDQGHAYASACFTLEPKLEKVEVEFWYLDSGEVSDTLTWTRDKASAMAKKWERKVDRMYNDKRFVRKPNRFCKWCARYTDNGGDCSG